MSTLFARLAAGDRGTFSGQPRHVIVGVTAFFIAVAAVAVLALWRLVNVVVSSTAWPAQRIVECSGDPACTTVAILTEAPLIWIGAAWFAGLVALVIRSRRFPVVEGSVAAIREQHADQRIGLTVGWVLVYSSLGFIAALFIGPLIAALIANSTWTQAKVDRCSDDPLCVLTTLPGNGLPVGAAFAWLAVIAAAMIICRKPSRWWLPGPAERRFSPRSPFVNPFGVGPHAIVAAVTFLLLSPGVQQRGKEVYAPEYLWAFLAASTLAAVSWYRYQKVVGPRDPNEPPALVFETNQKLVAVNEEWREAARTGRPLSSSPNARLREAAERSRNAVIGGANSSSEHPPPSVLVSHPPDWIAIPDCGPGLPFGAPRDWATAVAAEMAAVARTRLSAAHRQDLIESLTSIAVDAAAREVQRCYVYFDSFRGIFRSVEAMTIAGGGAGSAPLSSVASVYVSSSFGEHPLSAGVIDTGLPVVMGFGPTVSVTVGILWKAGYLFAVRGGYFALRAETTDPGGFDVFLDPLANLAATVADADPSH
ncbi:hypothetical protein [Salinibacterium sp. PAMC 21357]|uniref:hypothetical protein n=1 Tax=Salinibacterium sp. PAMC 21357 TaxID=1112215 RepID=UPI0002884DE1|nr:hypothetical protein [Salinibacterium sp. PAMC 21357]